MTFDQIRSEVLERMSLSSTDASTRVGAAINRHYKRITSLLGMETTRYVSKDVLMTIGVRTVTVPGVEKVDRVADISGQPRPLSEVSLHQMRTLEPTAVEPQVWALSNTQAQSVVLMFDTFPAFAWTLRIDGWTTLTDLTGSGEPAFPASFHDILTWFVLAEELLRKEKSQLAAAYEQKAAGLLEDLRFHLADTHTRTLVQNSHPGGATGGSGQGGGGGGPGGAQYLTNIPPGTVVGRASDQGTGNSQPITLGPRLSMTGTLLDVAGTVVDVSGAPVAGAVAEFADANTIRAVTRALVDKTGTPAANQVAIFNDADTIRGDANLSWSPGSPGGGSSLTITSPYGYCLVVLTDPTAPAGQNAIGISNTAGTLQLLVNGTNLTALNAYADGRVYLPQGRLQFPAVQVPSADPYTFDDYREGEWTPLWQGSGGQSGQVYSSRGGTFLKKGRDVFCTGWLVLTTLGTISGSVQIGGLPFVSDGNPPAGIITFTTVWSLNTAIASIVGHINPSSTYAAIRYFPGGGATSISDLQQTDLTAATYAYFTAHYIALN